MNKYRASKSQLRYRLLPLPGFVFVLFACGKAFQEFLLDDANIVYWIMTIVASLYTLYVAVLWIRAILIDPLVGRVSFNDEAVVFYTATKTYVYPYEDVEEIGFARGPGSMGYIYYVYFSKKRITNEMRPYFIPRRKPGKELKNCLPEYITEYVYYQYQPEVFKSMLEHLPKRFKQDLIDFEKNMVLSFGERIMHR